MAICHTYVVSDEPVRQLEIRHYHFRFSKHNISLKITTKYKAGKTIWKWERFVLTIYLQRHANLLLLNCSKQICKFSTTSPINNLSRLYTQRFVSKCSRNDKHCCKQELLLYCFCCVKTQIQIYKNHRDEREHREHCRFWENKAKSVNCFYCICTAI